MIKIKNLRIYKILPPEDNGSTRKGDKSPIVLKRKIRDLSYFHNHRRGC